MSGKWEPAKGPKGVSFARALSTEKLDRLIQARRSVEINPTSELSSSSGEIHYGTPPTNTNFFPTQSHLQELTQRLNGELILKSPSTQKLSSSSQENITLPHSHSNYQPLSSLPPPVIQISSIPPPISHGASSPNLHATSSAPSTPTASNTSSPPVPPPRPPKNFQEQFCNVELERNRENLIITKNLSKCSEKLQTLQVDFQAVQDKFKELEDENDTLSKLEPISALITTLSSQVNDILNENEHKMKKVYSNSPVWTNVKDFSCRISEICEALMNCNLEQKENQSESRFTKQNRALLQLLQKIYNEETVFTGKLVCLQRFFRGSLENNITPREDALLFSSLEDILTLHKEFIKDVEFTLNKQPNVGVGQLFEYYVPKFTPYLSFIQNSREAKEVLENLLKDKEKGKIIRNLEKANKCNLTELLGEPLRKVEQYLMYTEQFFHLTPPNSPDRSRLEEVVEKFQELLDLSVKKDNIADALQKLQQIGEEIEGMNENLVVPDRELIREGFVSTTKSIGGKGSALTTSGSSSTGDFVFLFSDLVLFVKSQKKSGNKKYLFIEKLPMHHVKTVVDQSISSFALEINTTPKKSEYILSFGSEKDKENWLMDFTNLQRKFFRFRKVFGVPLNTLVKREDDGCLIPHFVDISINFIRQYGLNKEGIFRLSGRATQVEKLRDQLDQGKKVFFSENMDCHTVATLFKQWLRELPEPILTWKLYESFIATDSMEEPQKLEALSNLINKKLPKINRSCFQHMMKLLTEVTANESKTKLNASSLAVVFAPNVLSSADLDSFTFQMQFESVNNIFRDMLVHYDYIFNPANLVSSDEIPTRIRKERKSSADRRSKSGSLRHSAGNILAPSTKFEDTMQYLDKKKWIECSCALQDDQLYIFKNFETKNRIRVPLVEVTKIFAQPFQNQDFAFHLERKKGGVSLAVTTEETLTFWVELITSKIKPT